MKTLSKRPNRYPFLPIVLFLVTYAFVQLYSYSYTLFAITVASLLFLLGIYHARKAYVQDRLLLPASRELDSLNTSELRQVLAYQFRRRGYAVKRNDDSFIDMTLKRGRVVTLVHIQNDEKNTFDSLKKLHAFKLQQKAARAMFISRQSFTDDEIQWAKANKINLVDRSMLEAIVDVPQTEERPSVFIERARSLLTDENHNET